MWDAIVVDIQSRPECVVTMTSKIYKEFESNAVTQTASVLKEDGEGQLSCHSNANPALCAGRPISVEVCHAPRIAVLSH